MLDVLEMIWTHGSGPLDTPSSTRRHIDKQSIYYRRYAMFLNMSLALSHLMGFPQ